MHNRTLVRNAALNWNYGRKMAKSLSQVIRL